jgi:hypothetical protein
MLEKFGAKSYRLDLPFIIRRYHMFRVNILRLYLTATLRLSIHVTTLEDDDDEYGPDRISLVKIDIVP